MVPWSADQARAEKKSVLITPEDIILNRETKIFGSEGEMQILEELKKPRQLLWEDLYELRIARLNEWSSLKLESDETQHSRNALDNGGKVDIDVQLIKLGKDPSRSESWKKAFFKYYGVPYDLVENKVEDLPQKLQQTLNHRASTHSMRLWRTTANELRKSHVMGNANSMYNQSVARSVSGYN